MDDENVNEFLKHTEVEKQMSFQEQQQAQMQYMMQEQEKTLAEAQLEVESILQEIYHMLRQDVYKPKPDGSFDWFPIEDSTQRVLTDYGVERIMQVMKSYVNKNTLLSNFDAEMIKKRMLNFSLSLNANIFMKYEIYFREPSLEEVKGLLDERIRNQVKIKKYASELAGENFDEEEIKEKVLKNVENRVEYELNKIKEEVRRRNLREYELLFRQLEAIVEATHNRAWRGEERGSLRRHMNVSEILGTPRQTPRESGGIFKWMKR
jgi:hypothetical protein